LILMIIEMEIVIVTCLQTYHVIHTLNRTPLSGPLRSRPDSGGRASKLLVGPERTPAQTAAT